MMFFTTYEVKNVEVRGNAKYSEEEVKAMVLKGPFAGNSVLAPFFCSKKESDGTYLVDSWNVTRLSKDSIAINFYEKKPVGSIRYLDSYVYFDRKGTFVGSSLDCDESIPFFDGITVHQVTYDEKLPVKGTDVLNTAGTLATIFQKGDRLPDFVQFDDKNQVSLVFDDITAYFGKNENLDDKVTRTLAILPKLEGKKGILHLESVSENNKTITFEETGESSPDAQVEEEWEGGYDASGNYTGDGEYNEKGKYVGAKPLSDLENAIENWAGGYDGEGDYTGSGEYDEQGNYAGAMPDEDSFAALGSYRGGYTEDGRFTWTGEFDRHGNYVGPDTSSDGESSGNSIDSYFSSDSETGSEENSISETTDGSASEGSENSDGNDPDSESSSESGHGYDDASYDDISYDDSYDYDSYDYESYDEGSSEDGGIYDEAYYDALYEGIYW